MTDPLVDENNNNEIDLNAKMSSFINSVNDVRDDSSNASEAESGNSYTISTNSSPPEDPDRIHEKTDTENDSDTISAELFLKCKVKKLEAEVDSLRTQLSRVGITDRNNNMDDRNQQDREKCVVFKCIPQAHITSEVFRLKISQFFKISYDDLVIQITDQLNKWCVVVLHTPSKHDATRILKNFNEFKKLYQSYHRTQALPCFSNSERKLYQQLWAEAIEKNNKEGYRKWEVDPQELILVETVGIKQKWRVKVHYYPEDDSLTASTSAIEVRKKQRSRQLSNVDKIDNDNDNNKKQQHPKNKKNKKRNDQKMYQIVGQRYQCEGYECLQTPYVSHYVPQMPPHFAAGCHNYYIPHNVFNGISYYSQPITTTTQTTTTELNTSSGITNMIINENNNNDVHSTSS